MDITYLGHSSFKIRGKSVTVVTDPYDSGSVGLKFPKHVPCDIVTVSHDHQDHNAVSQLDGSPYVVKGAGEYEIKACGIVGLRSYHDESKGSVRGGNTIYRLEIDGINLVHLGDLGHVLGSSDVDALDGVDVLFVPVGGVYTIDAEKAAEVVSEIEPSIVIPMHYKRDGLDEKTFGSLSPVSAFLTTMGKPEIEAVPKLTLTKDKLPGELQVIVLS